jgi:hypothetical protein
MMMMSMTIMIPITIAFISISNRRRNNNIKLHNANANTSRNVVAKVTRLSLITPVDIVDGVSLLLMKCDTNNVCKIQLAW